MAEANDKSPEQQEAEGRAKSGRPRRAADEVADVPAVTSDATEGSPREASESKTGRLRRAQLLEQSGALFSVPPWIVAGALHDVPEDQTMTVAQVQARIDKFTDRGERS